MDSPQGQHPDGYRKVFSCFTEAATDSIMFSGDRAIEFCQKAMADWVEIRAICNEKWERGSLVSDQILEQHLVEFHTQCVDDDLADIIPNSDEAEARLILMEAARKNLIEAFEKLSKKVKVSKRHG